MAVVQLFSQGVGQGLQTFQLAEANFEDAEINVNYYQNAMFKTQNPRTLEDVYCFNLTIPTAGMDYLTINKTYSPIPSVALEKHEDNGVVSYYTSVTDPNALPITSEPPDWAIHWRDKYNNLDKTSNNFYFQQPLIPGANNAPPPAPTELFPKYETNQGRYIWWTMDGNYFPLTVGWFAGETTYTENTGYQGVRFGFCPFGGAAWGDSWQNVNNPRFDGVSGQLVFTNQQFGGMSFCYEFDYRDLATTVQPSVFWSFIGFKYKFTETVEGQPIEKEEELIGIVAWKESIDGIPLNAQIIAMSKNFFGVRKKPASGGPISGIQGGTGAYDGTSNNHGDRTGSTATNIVNDWNGSSVFMSGYNNYLLSPSNGNHRTAFSQFVQNLWDPDIWDGFVNKMMNPVQSILSCQQVPSVLVPAASVVTGSSPIYAAGVQLSVEEVSTFSAWYTTKNIGTIDLSEYSASFADYTNTSVYINLPYVGLKPIDVASCMNGWLAVDYMTDLFTGDCTAIVTVQDRFGNTQLRYEYKGHCGRDLPLIQRVPISTTVASAIIPAAVGLGTAAAGGSIIAASVAGQIAASSTPAGLGTVGMGAQAIKLAAERQANAVRIDSAKSWNTGLQTMSTSATAAALSGQNTTLNNASGGGVSSPINTNCWVLITRPQWSNPELYDSLRAYPSDISGKVGDFGGFLCVSEVDADNIECTDVERAEIMQRLGAGVFLD